MGQGRRKTQRNITKGGPCPGLRGFPGQGQGQGCLFASSLSLVTEGWGVCTETLGDLPGLWCWLCPNIDLLVLQLSVTGVCWSQKPVCFLSVVPDLDPTLWASFTARQLVPGIRRPSWEHPSPRTSSSLAGWLGEPSSSALGFPGISDHVWCVSECAIP